LTALGANEVTAQFQRNGLRASRCPPTLPSRFGARRILRNSSVLVPFAFRSAESAVDPR
jgi:hypothetical protein